MPNRYSCVVQAPKLVTAAATYVRSVPGRARRPEPGAGGGGAGGGGPRGGGGTVIFPAGAGGGGPRGVPRPGKRLGGRPPAPPPVRLPARPAASAPPRSRSRR